MSVKIGKVELNKDTLRNTIPMEIAPSLHIVRAPFEAEFISVMATSPGRQDRFNLYYECDPHVTVMDSRLIGLGGEGSIINPPGTRPSILIGSCVVGSDLMGWAPLFFYDLGNVYDDA